MQFLHSICTRGSVVLRRPGQTPALIARFICSWLVTWQLWNHSAIPPTRTPGSKSSRTIFWQDSDTMGNRTLEQTMSQKPGNDSEGDKEEGKFDSSEIVKDSDRT